VFDVQQRQKPSQGTLIDTRLVVGRVLPRHASFESRITLRGIAIFDFRILTSIMTGQDPPSAIS